MIVLLNTDTKETQIVDHSADDFANHYGAEWQYVRDLAEGERPEWLTYDAEEGAVVSKLATLEAALHARIDAEAGKARMRFISDSPGQQLTYQRKEAEARAFLAAPETPLSALPFLSGEMDATGADAATCAAAIVAAADSWILVGSRIERCRIAAKRAISAATTAADMNAAAHVDWDEAIMAGSPA